jgi:hypothetical protein
VVTLGLLLLQRLSPNPRKSTPKAASPVRFLFIYSDFDSGQCSYFFLFGAFGLLLKGSFWLFWVLKECKNVVSSVESLF